MLYRCQGLVLLGNNLALFKKQMLYLRLAEQKEGNKSRDTEKEKKHKGKLSRDLILS